MLRFLYYAVIRAFRPRPAPRGRPPQQPEDATLPPGRSTAFVLHVIDGDTVVVRANGQNFRIRLDSIDCPEDGQHWGDIAKYGLIKLIGNRTVTLENHGLDIHGRTLATIYVGRRGTDELINVNERMVALGHAWVMRRFYGHLPQERQASLNRIEAWARSKRVGLWKSADAKPPWQWRAEDEQRRY